MSDEPGEIPNAVDKMFATLPTRTELRPFNNTDYCGILVYWVEQGTGFGEFTVSCNKATGEWSVDTETMGPEWCGEMLMRLMGTDVPTQEELDERERQAREHREGQSR